MHEALRDFVHLGFCARQNPAQSPGRCLQFYTQTSGFLTEKVLVFNGKIFDKRSGN
jgi:hypothetical protein